MNFSRIFVLTKTEQRTIALIVIGLVIVAMAQHYHDRHQPLVPTKAAPARTSPPPVDDEDSTPDDRSRD